MRTSAAIKLNKFIKSDIKDFVIFSRSGVDFFQDLMIVVHQLG